MGVNFSLVWTQHDEETGIGKGLEVFMVWDRYVKFFSQHFAQWQKVWPGLRGASCGHRGFRRQKAEIVWCLEIAGTNTQWRKPRCFSEAFREFLSLTTSSDASPAFQKVIKWTPTTTTSFCAFQGRCLDPVGTICWAVWVWSPCWRCFQARLHLVSSTDTAPPRRTTQQTQNTWQGTEYF